MASLPAAEVRAAIEKAGLKWEARETRISELARSTRPGSLFGLNIGEDDRQTLLRKGIAESAKFAAAAPAPPMVDWRNKNGNFVTPVKFQATCGSCVAHATCAVLESRSLIKNNTPGIDLDLSEAHLFSCGGGSCANGWNFEPALNQAKNTGVGLERDFPYEPKDVPCKQIPPKVKVTTCDSITPMNARKLAIASGGPVIAGMRVFSDFFSYSSGVYKHVVGSFEGLHAVAVVGYNNAETYWIIKNSWHTDWGENGFCRIGYGECGIDSDFPFFNPAVDIISPLAA